MAALVQVSVLEGVGVVALNRPEKRNALNIALLGELAAAFEGLHADPQNRVIVLRGEGSAFCSGMDLQEAADPANSEESAQALAKAFTTIAASPLVTVASVHGSALAGGAGLMTVCDLVVADAATRIGYPEVRRGLAAALVTVFLRRQIGDRAARELLLTGEPIGAQRALEIGLITRVAPAGSLAATTAEMTRQLLLGGPLAQASIKRFLEELSPTGLATDIRRALGLHSQVRKAEEAHEGILAFLERRPPNFARL